MAFGLEEMYGDGGSLFAYLGGNTWGRFDAGGLYTWDEYWDNLKDGADLVTHGYQAASSITDVHGLVREVAKELVSQYSSNLEWDVDWASDWSLGDDEHTRGDNRWVDLAIARGASAHFGMAYWEQVANETTFAVGGVTPRQLAFQVGRIVDRSGGIAGAAQRIVKQIAGVGQVVVFKFYRKAGGRALVKFPPNVIAKTVTGVPKLARNSDEARIANKMCGVSPGHQWVINGVPHLWHHHYKRGEMHLIPAELNSTIGHEGRKWW
jgi:hypothetical protein